MTSDSDSDDYVNRLVDRDALAGYLESQFGPAETFELERLGAGHSNETIYVEWGSEELALRRPPPGETAETAHDVLREYQIIDALQGELPVPPTRTACADKSVIGSEFYLTDFVSGDVLRDNEPERFGTPAHRREISEALIDTLSTINTVDYETIGLDEIGRPDGYLDRQVERMRKQIDWATDRTQEEREVPALKEVGGWLAANVPHSSGNALVHGDYKLDNVMFGPGTPPKLVTVFDWELSTLGDPLVDLGWLLVFWHDAGDPEPPIPEVVPTYTEHEGYLSSEELVDRYERQTGLEFEHRRFYKTFALYKVAAVCEMFYARYISGDSQDPLYEIMEERVPAIANRAQTSIEDGGCQ